MLRSGGNRGLGPAILTASLLQKVHSCRPATMNSKVKWNRDAAASRLINTEVIGSQDAVHKRMNFPKKHGKALWIADELIGIRTLEQRLSKKLQTRPSANSRILLKGIRALNIRIDLLDRALDEFSRSSRSGRTAQYL